MKKSLIAVFYILAMLGSGAALAADDSQNNQQAKEQHASAKYVDIQTLTEDGCG